MQKIIVLGSSNTDMIVKVPRIPAAGETILGGTFMQAAGGKGANQAVAAARAGGQVTFIAMVGADDLGAAAIAGLKNDGIDTSLVFTDQHQASGVALIFVDANGENSIAVASGANAGLLPEILNQCTAAFAEAGMLLLQLESPLITIEAAARKAKTYGLKVILNPAPAQVLSDALLAQVDVLTPNETEAELLTGITVKDLRSANQAADALIHKGVQTVIITLGAQGVFVKDHSTPLYLPAFQVEAVDTTGAGDTFNGVLTVGLAEGRPLEEAIQLAQAAAALSVTRMGAQPSIPERGAIERFWRLETGG